MNIIKSLLIGSLSLLTLSGCTVTKLMGVGGTEFSLELSGANEITRGGSTYIAKNTPQLHNKCSTNHEGGAYFFWGGFCNFDGLPPEKIELQYAKWKPFNQIPEKYYQSEMTAYADSLPASAWKTVTVYPRQFMSQVKSSKKVDGTPLLPGSIATKYITMVVVLDENGNVTLKDKYGYVTTSDAIR